MQRATFWPLKRFRSWLIQSATFSGRDSMIPHSTLSVLSHAQIIVVFLVSPIDTDQRGVVLFF